MHDINCTVHHFIAHQTEQEQENAHDTVKKSKAKYTVSAEESNNHHNTQPTKITALLFAFYTNALEGRLVIFTFTFLGHATVKLMSFLVQLSR